MKITKIQVQNYRLLRDFSIDLEDDLSLVVGKNNTGKTSLLYILDKFLNAPQSFSFNDFNLDFKHIMEILVNSEVSEEHYEPKGIHLLLHIEHDDEDNLANLSKLMMNLEPNNKKVVLHFEYSISYEKLTKLKRDFSEFTERESSKPKPKGLTYFLEGDLPEYFKVCRKTIDPGGSGDFKDIDKENISIKNVLNYKFIKADRDVSNKEANNSLSGLSSTIYENIEADEDHQAKIDQLKDTLLETDKDLDDLYNGSDGIFKGIIDKVGQFGGLTPNETLIRVKSSLQHKDLLKGNATVVYNHDDHELPESYNGLGYMNLISMIFEIEVKVNEFKRGKEEIPADINLLFIEEPEAHTHPQMQYVFIQNIKDLLEDSVGENHRLQYVVSTHSSHIVAESDFEDIKYLHRSSNQVDAKNLKQLESEYKQDGEAGQQSYKFLKQYLTLHRAELFFADKAIFIEGDTERILLPAMMKKVDQATPQDDLNRALLSQNISIVETGAHSKIFEKFIDFIGVKSLVITDLDSAMTPEKLAEVKAAEPDENKRKKIKQGVRVNDDNAEITTNASLTFFYGSSRLEDLKDKESSEMTLLKNPDTKAWEKSVDGNLLCVYQSTERNVDDEGYCARSFEDSFFHLNRQFMIDNESAFLDGIKNGAFFRETEKDAYELAEHCVKKKPSLAIEILLCSDIDEQGHEFSNWQTPDYINKGLLWLKTDQT